jgi:hypothetical protein
MIRSRPAFAGFALAVVENVIGAVCNRIFWDRSQTRRAAGDDRRAPLLSWPVPTSKVPTRSGLRHTGLSAILPEVIVFVR